MNEDRHRLLSRNGRSPTRRAATARDNKPLPQEPSFTELNSRCIGRRTHRRVIRQWFRAIQKSPEETRDRSLSSRKDGIQSALERRTGILVFTVNSVFLVFLELEMLGGVEVSPTSADATPPHNQILRMASGRNSGDRHGRIRCTAFGSGAD